MARHPSKSKKLNKPHLSDDPVEVIARKEGVSKEQVNNILTIAEHWSGPLPPPMIFKQYPKDVQATIVKQADAQMRHRHHIEKQVVNSNVTNATIGVYAATTITVIMVIGGIILILNGRSVEGLSSIFVPTAFQAGNYIVQRVAGFNKVKRDIENENDSAVNPDKNS